jgi:4-diphosphocytidyl-2-C-methyl-D-erythritol kinase
MILYDVPAPAKVNLFLHVVGRRADGYHLLQTVFRFIDLCDTLHIESRADGIIRRAGPVVGVPVDQDLALRAARALQIATGTQQGAQISSETRSPLGGGLGGGSSDAASVLIALNRLWATGLSRQALMALALSLGADVPLFIFGQSAFAEGVGERLTALTLPERAYLVVQPDVSVSTAEIFSDPDLTRDTSLVKIEKFTSLSTPYLNGGGGKNDLAPVVYRKYPQVAETARWLTEQGMQVRMTGSGACLYVEYAKFCQAVLAQQEITATMRLADKASNQTHPRLGLVQACSGLLEHPLRNWIAK